MSANMLYGMLRMESASTRRTAMLVRRCRSGGATTGVTAMRLDAMSAEPPMTNGRAATDMAVPPPRYPATYLKTN